MKTEHLILSITLSATFAFHSALARAAPDGPDPRNTNGNGDPNKERRDGMHKGNAEYVQRNWEAARDAYRKSWDIGHHYTIAANLADVEMKMGHYAEAVGYLKYVLANLPPDKTAERKHAEEQLLECRNHLTVVRIATNVADATVLVDGRNVGQTPLREDVLLEPGKHVISVTKPGYGEATTELSAEGSKVEVTLTLEKASAASPKQPEAATPVAVPQRTQPAPSGNRSTGYRIGSYVGFGAGAVGVGLGTLLLLTARSRQSEADNEYSTCYPRCSSAQKSNIADLDQSAQHRRTAGAVSFIVGGLGLATGATLLVVDSKQRSQANARHLQPWFGLGLAGVSGTF